MEVRTETERTYWLGMTETQARDLLNHVSDTEPDTRRVDPETLGAVRQALLNAGITKDPK